MRRLPLALIFPVLVSAGPSPSPVGPPQGCPLTVTEGQAPTRGLPEVYYEQGRATIMATNAHPRLLAGRRSGTIGKVTYALLVYQTAPNAPATVDAVAVDWTARRRWDLRGSCDAEGWTEGLMDMMEAMARLPEVAR